MKGSISYLPEEQELAEAWEKAVKDATPNVEVRKSDRHPPFKHVYLTIRNTGNCCKSNKND